MTPRNVQPAGIAHPAPQGTWTGTIAAAVRYEARTVATLANGLGSAAASSAATDLRGGSG